VSVRGLDRLGGAWLSGVWLSTRTEHHSIFVAREGEFVSWQQRAANHSLAIDFRSVRAAEIAHKQQPVCFHDQAVELGDTVALQDHVAHVFPPADDRDVACQNDRLTAIQRHQFGVHTERGGARGEADGETGATMPSGGELFSVSEPDASTDVPKPRPSLTVEQAAVSFSAVHSALAVRPLPALRGRRGLSAASEPKTPSAAA
jgi:hypothetical protein